MKDLKSINSRISFIIKTLGYSDLHFARKVGVSQVAVNNVINNNDDPSYALLRNITTVFPVSEKWLMIGEGKPWTTDNINNWKSGNHKGDKHRDVVKEINKRFKDFRDSIDLSQTLLASELGVTRDVISNIESLRVSPTIHMLIVLDKKYGLNIQWLLYGEGKMKRSGD